MKRVLFLFLFFLSIGFCYSLPIGLSPADQTVEVCPNSKEKAVFVLTVGSENEEIFELSVNNTYTFLEKNRISVMGSEEIPVFIKTNKTGNYSSKLNVCYLSDENSTTIVPCISAKINIHSSDDFCSLWGKDFSMLAFGILMSFLGFFYLIKFKKK